VLFVNANNLAFTSRIFDIAICGFMGWYECFDFNRGVFTQQEKKAKEIQRVLKYGGKFVCCSWEAQEDIRWMEDEILQHYPKILDDSEYLERRPIGMSYEKPEGYRTIFESAGLSQIEVQKERMTFVSSDEEEWWRQMNAIGWKSLIDKIDRKVLEKVKTSVFKDLQQFNRGDGIYFDKDVFYIRGVK
jgi:ubiquinone/menaquinone biosynthesis C-methylase UbiE